MHKLIYYIQQLFLTFSNQPSFFSSKRIERFTIFISTLISYNVYVWKRMDQANFTASEFMIVTGGFLAYAGFNIIQGKKDPIPTPETPNIPLP